MPLCYGEAWCWRKGLFCHALRGPEKWHLAFQWAGGVTGGEWELLSFWDAQTQQQDVKYLRTDKALGFQP